MGALRVATSAIFAISLAVLSAPSVPAQETIRVGFLGPLTGVFARAGKDMGDGLKLASEQSARLPHYGRDDPPAKP